MLVVLSLLTADVITYQSIHQLEYSSHKDSLTLPVKPYVKPIPLIPRKDTILRREVFGYLPYWRRDWYPSLNYDLLSVIAYFGVELGPTGNIINYHGWPVTGLIDLAHAHGVKVVLVAICFSSDAIRSIIRNPTYTQNAIRNLLEQVQLGNADGINIDFELPYSSDSTYFTDFMRALADTFHAHNPNYYVVLDVTAVNWLNRFQVAELAQICDAILIMAYDYYWAGSQYAGPVAPLTGSTYYGDYNVTNTVNYYLTYVPANKLLLGVPYYGYDWPVVDSSPRARTTGQGVAKTFAQIMEELNNYGRLWDMESQTPWYRYYSGGWHQCWYDDDTSLGLKYELVEAKTLRGIGIWALSYDGYYTQLWDAIYYHFVSPPLPTAPEPIYAVAQPGYIELLWHSSTYADGYKVYVSEDGESFDSLTTTADTCLVIDNLPSGRAYFFKIKSYNIKGESDFSRELIGAYMGYDVSPILIVNGFDSPKPGNTYSYVYHHGKSLANTGYGFASATNEAIISGTVELNDYMVVDWILGQEDISDDVFNPIEQQILIQYLEAGGHLLVSGSDIGYALGNTDFYHNYLHAEYVTDNTQLYQVEGVSPPFDGLTFNFDDGNHGIYRVRYPDAIDTCNGSRRILRYTGSNYFAGIAYEADYKLIYLSFPIETVYPQASRDTLMACIMRSWGVPQPICEPRIELRYNTVFSRYWQLNLSSRGITTVSIEVYDIVGRQLTAKRYHTHSVTFTWDATNVPPGVYFVNIKLNHTPYRVIKLLHIR